MVVVMSMARKELTEDRWKTWVTEKTLKNCTAVAIIFMIGNPSRVEALILIHFPTVKGPSGRTGCHCFFDIDKRFIFVIYKAWENHSSHMHGYLHTRLVILSINTIIGSTCVLCKGWYTLASYPEREKQVNSGRNRN